MPFKWLYPESTPFQEWRDDCYLNPGGFAQHGTWYESRNGDLASRVKHWPIRGSVPAKGLTIHIYHILSGYIWLVVPTFLKNCKNIWDNPSIIYVMKYTYIYICKKNNYNTGIGKVWSFLFLWSQLHGHPIHRFFLTTFNHQWGWTLRLVPRQCWAWHLHRHHWRLVLFLWDVHRVKSHFLVCVSKYQWVGLREDLHRKPWVFPSKYGFCPVDFDPMKIGIFPLKWQYQGENGIINHWIWG